MSPHQNNDEPTLQALSATQAYENPLTHTGMPNRDESDETACAHCSHPVARVDGQWVHTPQREREKLASWCRTPAIRATAQPGSSDKFFEHIKPGSFRATHTGMEIAERTIARTARAAQRVRDAEAELAAAREAEVAIRAIRRGSLGPDEALKMALELIGRRSDVVAVQLPKPTGVNGQDNHVWSHARHYIEQEFNGDVIVNDRIGINACDLADLGAIFLAAASRADAANVEDAAEDGAQ